MRMISQIATLYAGFSGLPVLPPVTTGVSRDPVSFSLMNYFGLWRH